MHQETKTKWLEALRSGNYEQGKFDLCFAGKFCCLGVLCDVVDPDGWSDDELGDPNIRRHQGVRTIPSEELLNMVGLPEDFKVDIEPEPVEDDEEPNPDFVHALTHLVQMNDSENKTFTQIADWIEEKL